MNLTTLLHKWCSTSLSSQPPRSLRRCKSMGSLETMALVDSDISSCCSTENNMDHHQQPRRFGSNAKRERCYSDCLVDNISTVSDDGTAAATASGGATPYTYAWSNGATTQNVNALAPNTYTVTVTDANQCTATASVDISENELFLVINCHKKNPINFFCS